MLGAGTERADLTTTGGGSEEEEVGTDGEVGVVVRAVGLRGSTGAILFFSGAEAPSVASEADEAAAVLRRRRRRVEEMPLGGAGGKKPTQPKEEGYD